MDIQFTGAVDFSPLFENMKTPQANKALFINKNPQGAMLAAQNSLLQPMNQQFEFVSLNEQSIGLIIDIIA